MGSRGRKKRTQRGDETTAGTEWMGGRLELPFLVEDDEGPVRVEVVAWIELPSTTVLAYDLPTPEDSPGALGRLLHQALEQPLAGAPRRPETIRVADESLAEEVRATLGAEIPVKVGPTPELDEFLDVLRQRMAGEDEVTDSHLTEGSVTPEVAADLYAGAAALFKMAPWNAVSNEQVLRMDIPALGVDGSCVTIIGARGESRGLLIFPSLTAYDDFADLMMGLSQEEREDLGTDWLSLTFVDDEGVPAAVQDEVQERGWSLATPDAYPEVKHRGRDGACRPLTARDVRIVSACAWAVAGFVAQNRSKFRAGEIEPIGETWLDQSDLEVHLTYPYEAFELFAQNDLEASEVRAAAPARVSGPRVGRNDPCPCGSGRKYKKCCLGRKDEARRQDSVKAETGRLEDRWIDTLASYARDRFGAEIHDLAKDFRDIERGAALALAWAVYDAEFEGRSVLEWYLDEHGHRLEPADGDWLQAQQASWLSVWEITSIDAGRGVTVRDLLSDETRWVDDVSISQSAARRDTVLTRVADYRGISVFSGMHPYPLTPGRAAEVVGRARRWLRRKKAVPVERLRTAAAGGYLIRRWEEAIDEMEERSRVPSQLTNTDGDPLILTVDHFKLAPGARADVEAALSAMDDVRQPDPEDEEGVYTFLRPGPSAGAGLKSTVIGVARLRQGQLSLETNSRERADALRERIEAACGNHVYHRGRELTDPLSNKVERPPSEPPGSDVTDPEAQQALLDFKERYYEDWLDQPLPALDGKSPREAVRTKEGREAVDLLLKDLENQEQRWQPETALDVSRLRRELGLD